VVASLNICGRGVGCHAQTGRESQSYDPGDTNWLAGCVAGNRVFWLACRNVAGSTCMVAVRFGVTLSWWVDGWCHIITARRGWPAGSPLINASYSRWVISGDHRAARAELSPKP